MEGGFGMSPVVLDAPSKTADVFSGSLESIAVVEEFERRRRLVAEGKSKLLSKEESLAALRQAGRHV